MARTQIKGRAPRTARRCAACGEILRSWAACERHRDEYGHGRFEVLDVDVS